MLSSAIIVFREVLEAALIVTILMAATKGLPGRTRWIFGGATAGLFGALAVAFSAGAIASTFEGMGQELFNAGILLTAVLMLAWHNIWMSKHARELVAHLKQVSSKVNEGSLPLYFLSVATGLAVLREGSEVVLFLYGVAAGGDSGISLLTGGIFGVVSGIIAGALLYFGLLRIPTHLLFKVTGWMILFLAAGLAASAAGYLMQAGILTAQAPLWNSSSILSERSIAGQLLHILVGYQARPTAIQLAFYLATLVLISVGMRWASRSESASRKVSKI
ncbi:FTR1 family protein [Vibrio fluvialis]|uniref:FTR1 family iron permease n=1 Tax=Vibrio fluvialis TaxID=676 RepID=UPI001C9C6379|nr:FTR1 family protein [Vibrio fluvialis]EKO3429593.1 FTR1 family protein [Vibrio fluvialis]EKO3436462.1 FTR1 family protein [Vibrio fluvialis]EKO3445564.1 FTR1 family protein [Vibrio fluvialis]ELG2961269.1 FTR1 family protein [Vibrio fluvialis]MBY8055787.1 FTR1 family protein [Vibrio fluvialis]